MKLNEKVGLLAFYTIVVVAIVTLSFGMLTLDKILITKKLLNGFINYFKKLEDGK